MNDLARIDNDNAEAIVPISIQPVTLFGTGDPLEVLTRAAKVANVLAAILNQQKLFAPISGRKYVTVEGWTLLGSMLGVFPRVEWTRKLEDGFEARAIAVAAANGQIVGAGEAQCTRTEATWKDRADYALRGMAQTRAISRAMRAPLGFIVKLAGYQPEVAEEQVIGPNDDEPAPRRTRQKAQQAEPRLGAAETPGGEDLAPSVPAVPSDEDPEMLLLYHLGATLPNRSSSKEELDLLVAEHGKKRIMMRLKSAHSLQCHTSSCEHLAGAL